MDLSKLSEVFKPESIPARIHIIGCGSVGSTIAELLARYGLTNFTLWDMDVVEKKNLVNQMFFSWHVGQSKVEAVKDIILSVNEEAETDIDLKPNGWHGEKVRGWVFLAVDNIEIRKEFVRVNKNNPHILGVFDVRTGLYDAQCWAAAWNNQNHIDNLINSMDFTHEEAAASTPVSACGIVQGVAPTVRCICTLAVTNFVNFATGNKLCTMITANPYDLSPDGFGEAYSL